MLDLEKLTYYLNYNFLYTTENVLKQLSVTESFRVIHVIMFIRKIDPQSFKILQYAKYLYFDLVPVDLLMSLLAKKKFEIQASIRLLLDLDLVELREENGLKGLKISHAVLHEVKVQSNELKVELETSLAKVLLRHFRDTTKFYYMSVVSFLAQSRNLSVNMEDNEFLIHIAQLYNLVGKFNSFNMRFERSIRFFETGLDWLQKASSHDDSLEESFYISLGVSYYMLSQYKEALGYFEMSRFNDEYADDVDESTTPRPYFIIGKCYFKVEDLENAEKHLEKAYQLKNINSNWYECIQLLSIVTLMLKNYSSALKYNKELLKMIKSNKNIYRTVDEMEAYFRLGVIKEKQDDLNESLIYFERAFETARKTNNARRITSILIKLGKISMKSENFNKAYNDFRTADEIRSSSVEFNYLEQAEPLHLIGVCHRRMKQYDQAKKYLEKGFRLRNKHHKSMANLDIVDSYVNLGLVHQALGDHAKCEGYFATAFEYKKELLREEIDVGLLDQVAKWSNEMVREHLDKRDTIRINQCFGHLTGKELARIYLFGKEDFDLIKDMTDKKTTKQDAIDFIDWFGSLSL